MGPTNIFGNLAAELAGGANKTLTPGVMPGGGVPNAGAASQNKSGLFGLGGPGVGIMDKFGGMVSGMFGGGQGGAAQQMPRFAEGGGVAPAVPAGSGDNNPYSAQVTVMDNQIQAAKNSIMQSLPKEDWETAMQQTVFPLMQKRQELAQLSSQWATENPPGTYQGNTSQTPNMQVSPTPGQGQEANQTQFGGTGTAAKVRKITIEEKPSGKFETKPSEY